MFAQNCGVGLADEDEPPSQSGWLPNEFDPLPIATGWSESKVAERRRLIDVIPISLANQDGMFCRIVTCSCVGWFNRLTVSLTPLPPSVNPLAAGIVVASVDGPPKS